MTAPAIELTLAWTLLALCVMGLSLIAVSWYWDIQRRYVEGRTKVAIARRVRAEYGRPGQASEVLS